MIYQLRQIRCYPTFKYRLHVGLNYSPGDSGITNQELNKNLKDFEGGFDDSVINFSLI